MNVFEVFDRNGKLIRLTKEQWRHITSSSSHSYMANYLGEIIFTLTKPDRIVESVYDEFKINFYKFYKNKGKYLRVIVRYLNGNGFIITAYFVRNIVK